ncbi:leucine-rich repeat-containing protein kinase family protein [Methylocystis parvus]|uniref:Protein kinase n=1 Tax=Methylocystis parvus TaxID=134 RepID=A0A6B8M5I7_9HYPH|nr:leucine-rich repeat-containing protein kinase family protein [Methylocystis parvus]QGM97392.1 protein kinase [Methylocystis parvus]WBJ98695.1 leucine-rich repeat-containing serine/threonine-protein kinase [Methylocystis parvus OBBP]
MPTDSSAALTALRRGDLAGARELRLPGLAEFPREIFDLADTLEILDLSNGSLTALPEDIGRLANLRALFCSGNRFERLPPALGGCAALSQIGFRGAGMREVPAEALPSQLRWLTLTDNRIERLPAEIGERPLLQKLMLAGNRLDRLPETLAGAPNLELIRLSANQFDALPIWLSQLPRLAWIAWAGNPFERAPEAASAALVSWHDIDVGALLGEGASGRVYRASWRKVPGDAPLPAALKIFKGAMTSDGLPEREMLACLAAGEHPNLTAALGRLHDHPEGAQALLTPLTPAHWRVLAGPPSLESCSRDVYDASLRLDVGTVKAIARNIGAAAAHLHGRGLLHGDLYAHNTLWDGDAGAATLSDFGAACALPAGNAGDAWRRVEVRAFGLLLGELVERVADMSAEREQLRLLAEACAHSRPQSRPLMEEALEALRR